MKNSWKVASWEINRNLKNKSFLISLFLTPLIFLGFAFVPTLLNSFDSEPEYTLYIQDELGVFETLEAIFSDNEEITIHQVEQHETVFDDIKEDADQGVILLDEHVLETKTVSFYTGDESEPTSVINSLSHALAPFIQQIQMVHFGLEEQEIEQLQQELVIDVHSLQPTETDDASTEEELASQEGNMSKIVQGVFAGVILFGVVMTGMMTFTSATQEKKDKISEILLSSVTSSDLMQGKIIGYFVLGLLQVGLWLLFGVLTAQLYFDIPVIEHLLGAHLVLLLVYAVGGYLLFSSLFAAVGATMEDMNTAGNFIGLVFMLPFLPFFFIGPIIHNPNGILAQVVSYIPFTTPAIMVIRLTIAEQIPLLEIIISLIILLVSIVVMIKVAGKVYRIGILMYGKNATPKEIWKWIRE